MLYYQPKKPGLHNQAICIFSFNFKSMANIKHITEIIINKLIQSM